MTSYSNLNQSLKIGMYVRVPIDTEETERDFRDFRIGPITGIDEISDMVTVNLLIYAPNEKPKTVSLEYPRIFVERCHILPDTEFVHRETNQLGRILITCEDQLLAGEFCRYFVRLDGQVKCLSEAKIIAPSHRQDPHPYQQMRHYEFQHEVWKFERDHLIESYAELRAATFGIEDLVGSRVMLLAHQAEVVTRVLGDETCRYVLADEVGLGKTIEAAVILKGLHRRHPGIKTLIVAPASLTRQWYYELNDKFWLDFAMNIDDFLDNENAPGLIISTEALSGSGEDLLFISAQDWGLFIVDEAHHIYKTPQLYQRVHQLSSEAKRVLILSATPIQRRAKEYLALLKIMNPLRYDPIDEQAFEQMLQSQKTIRRTIAYLAQTMNPDEFDPDEFIEEMEDVINELNHDTMLVDLVKRVEELQTQRDHGLGAARETLAYVSENYRIESRVIRNRRANLQVNLPQRTIDTTYSYRPGTLEREALEELHDYCGAMMANNDTLLVLEYCRILFHAGFSTPHSLLDLLQKRQTHLAKRSSLTTNQTANLLRPAEPRKEMVRIGAIITCTPTFSNEQDLLNKVIRLVETWRIEIDEVLQNLPFRTKPSDLPHRLVQTLRLIHQFLFKNPEGKIVIFSTWQVALDILYPQLRKIWDVAQFHTQIPSNKLQDEVDRFQSEPRCQIMLCDELGGEGRNFQIADLIIHLDLPWTPTKIEQRIGRVDRVGRQGTVLSVVPFAQETLEQDLFNIWQEAFQLFTRSMSGMEIVLEGIQDELLETLRRNSRNGLAHLLPAMTEHGKSLHEEIEEARYFEEGAINYRRRKEFDDLSKKYRDGTLLGKSITGWANLAGLENSYHPHQNTVRYSPKHFNLKSMYNAKYFSPPNMEEALVRSGRVRNQVITGTFNRDVAVCREDLVFFAPGDPWTDTIIHNAIEADRGRSSAILRRIPNLDTDWQGFELLYSLQINPRPLYKAGYDPVHILQAQGYLYTATHRLLISINGEVLKPSHLIWKYLKTHQYKESNDIHLGKRSNQAYIQEFKKSYPADIWATVLDQIFKIANHALEEEFSFMTEMAEEAIENFEIQLSGLKAAQYWLNYTPNSMTACDPTKVEEYKQIFEALVEGIERPLWVLESACFWVLQPIHTHE